MALLSCAGLGLEITIQAAHLRLENCLCHLARSASVVPMAPSASRVTPAIGWGSRPPDHRSASRIAEVDRRDG